MAHHAKINISTQIYGLISVIILVLGIIINFIIRPDLFSMSIPYSLYGATPETKLIFSASLILTGLFFLYESHFIANRFQRFGCYAVTLGFVIVAAVPIRISPQTDIVHGIGAALVLFGLFVNLLIGIVSRSKVLTSPKRLYYAALLGVGVSSVILAILTRDMFGLELDLLGYAEYSGFVVFAGWTLVDFGDKFESHTH